jgi:pSer/pThr/pTyr-binding forkhead associated (FHA) protein
VVVIEADRAFYEEQSSPDVPVPFPDGAAPREVPLKSDEVLIGRRSDSRGIFPDVDLSVAPEDPAVSRRHAVLHRRPDGSWVVIDQGSTNGTRLGGTKAPLAAGEERIVLNGDHLLVGAWTRITLKRSVPSG